MSEHLETWLRRFLNEVGVARGLPGWGWAWWKKRGARTPVSIALHRIFVLISAVSLKLSLTRVTIETALAGSVSVVLSVIHLFKPLVRVAIRKNQHAILPYPGTYSPSGLTTHEGTTRERCETTRSRDRRDTWALRGLSFVALSYTSPRRGKTVLKRATSLDVDTSAHNLQGVWL